MDQKTKEKKTVMILGGGIYQVPLIKRAREMGLYTVVASIPGPYPGLSIADRVLSVDTRDREKILRAAEALQIDGIVTTGTDVAVRSIGAVCDRLGLCGISEKAAASLTDKTLMKQKFREGGVRTAEFVTVTDYDGAVRAADFLGYPVMMKASDVSGSRGITKVSRAEELKCAFDEAVRVSKKGHFVVERFLPGEEIGVDGFVKNGKMILCLPHTKYTEKAGGVTIPAGHAFPYPAPDSVLNKIREEMQKVVSVTGMDNCAFNADVMMTDGEPYIIEAGGRCGATGIPELITLSTGVDYYGQILRSALGMPTDFEIRSDVRAESRLLFSRKGGVLQSVDEELLNQLRADGNSITVDYRPGDEIPALKNGTDRIGQIVTCGRSHEETVRVAEKVRSALKIV